MVIGEMLNTILSGGLTGLIGTIASSWITYKQQQMNNEHEIAKIKANSEAMKIEAEANIKIAEAKTAGELQLAEMQAFETSIEEGGKEFVKDGYIDRLFSISWLAPVGALLVLGLGFVDFLRGLARPLITYYMLGISTWLTYMAYAAIDRSVSTVKMAEIFEDIVQAIIYITITVVAWWFGDRQLYKMIKNKR